MPMLNYLAGSPTNFTGSSVRIDIFGSLQDVWIDREPGR